MSHAASLSRKIPILSERHPSSAQRTAASHHEIRKKLEEFSPLIEGSVEVSPLYRMLYAQDASIYREEPLGVAFPRHKEDLRRLILFAHEDGIPLIPRAAGTSLAGQCVGSGLVVDVGRFMNKVLEIDPAGRTARVQPGVIRDDLNRMLAEHRLFFAPETSTSSRCMLGGMLANNSCGSNSIRYGTTREHVVELELLFVDGTLERFGRWDSQSYADALRRQDVVGDGLRAIAEVISTNKSLIQDRYPRSDVVRRNSGYPLDIVACRAPFHDSDLFFSLPEFICGTEGTIAFITEAVISLEPLPAAESLACVHFHTLDESLRATLVALKHLPSAVEIIDKRTLDSARLNLEQEKNRFFLEGDPAAILAIQCDANTEAEASASLEAIIADLKAHSFGYAYPIIPRQRHAAVWDLRKEGLGIVMGQPGDVKPETSIEDTAVPVDCLPEYINEVLDILHKYQTPVMIYGHVSVGVVHLRPELNLKSPVDKEKFLKIADEVAVLVAKYRGSISGEHGDGRIRSPYLRQLLGDELMDAHEVIKKAFDPKCILNPGKIVNPKPLDADWRVRTGEPTPELTTHYNWSAKMGLIRAVEKCNGVGVCRRSAESGGTMCPSYMATLDEKDSTRGRANLFQQLFWNNKDPREAFLSEELYDALDLCLSCKGCKRDCPSNIDMARMKAEFLQAYYDVKGTPLSARLFGYYSTLARIGALTPRIANFWMTNKFTKPLVSVLMGVSRKRSMPLFAGRSFRAWFKTYRTSAGAVEGPLIWLYVDPFTEYTEPEIAQSAVRLLSAAGYRVELFPIRDDGRTLLSKGFLRDAKKLIKRNLTKIAPLFAAHPEAMIVGLEPSALLTFRDETPDLVDDKDLRAIAQELSRRSRLFEEFVQENQEQFKPLWRKQTEQVVLHGHCHQKALVGTGCTEVALRAAGYEVETLKTGCCGMAGSFGYEEKHYDVSMKIGELVLFPALRKRASDLLIAAPGTSCRHQIKDGVQRQAYHPVQLLERAMLQRDGD
jgi:FAD/FMN-containing dehydrogenase/Fe-S oxidoreductase